MKAKMIPKEDDWDRWLAFEALQANVSSSDQGINGDPATRYVQKA
jgi:hypothetical protein